MDLKQKKKRKYDAHKTDEDCTKHRAKTVAAKSACAVIYKDKLLAKNQLGFALCLIGASKSVREEILLKAVFNDLPSFLQWVIAQGKPGKNLLSAKADKLIHNMITNLYLQLGNEHARINSKLIEDYGLRQKSFEHVITVLRENH